MYAAKDLKEGEHLFSNNGTQFINTRSRRFEDFEDKDRIDEIINLPALIKLSKENVVTLNIMFHLAWVTDSRNEDWMRHLQHHELTPLYSFTDEEIELMKPDAAAYKYAKEFRKDLIVKLLVNFRETTMSL